MKGVTPHLVAAVSFDCRERKWPRCQVGSSGVLEMSNGMLLSHGILALPNVVEEKETKVAGGRESVAV